ncbi:lytic transglycosylase domain-containing protein [Psychrobium sp. 1_MG-2023]|uniref:lytic transglycosylase domain-containing protein n=1 Tax=Psychrobium sp. 1_MG-2023 TaxID=3062624 RepID=UPI000C346F9C|nr:lytic transglycosylase domain-containing protein [Psychrobium sp. 1_MG-2023]MDP2560075.1 lytic transglycosylase domain-containing protein [Psychrobium sp. 1_MG-2023]PKF56265.1 lytic transglycosylase [Alteromonadales bacterium alter-6D02]
MLRYVRVKLFFATLISVLTINIEAKEQRVYQYTKADGSVVFTDTKPAHHRFKLLKYDCYACQVNSSVNWHNTPLFPDKFKQHIQQASAKNKLDIALIQAVVHAESAFKPQAVSRVGAQGLMQLMPETAKELGVTNAFEISQNITAGTQYLASLLIQFNGDISLAIAAYNAGASNVRKYHGIPPFKETQHYVKRVNILYQRYALANNSQ